MAQNMAIWKSADSVSVCLCVCITTCALEVSNGSAGDAAIFSIFIASLVGSPADGGALYMTGAGA